MQRKHHRYELSHATLCIIVGSIGWMGWISTVHAEDSTTKEKSAAESPVWAFATFFEAGGRTILGSFNAELQYFGIGVLQVGVGVFTDGSSADTTTDDDEESKFLDVMLPVSAGVVIGREPTEHHDHMLELTGGLTYFALTNTTIATGNIGYRYQHKDGWLARGGLTPLLALQKRERTNPDGEKVQERFFVPWIQGSFGYVF